MRLLKKEYVCRLEPSDLTFSGHSIAWARLQGYLDGLNDVGVESHNIDVIHIPVNNTEYAKKAVDTLYTDGNGPQLLLCMSDVIAIAVIDELFARGIDVPSDVQVTGFDDIPQASHARVPLTTVCQQGRQKGELACAMLLGVNNSEQMKTLGSSVKAKVIIREST